ncbi:MULTISPECIES: Fic family protein [unclassified Leuconostoc]|uniref:Fic family protein n=1 Tax=unclassified Leuconostoc TaxID=2685106 RepID=UPI001907E39A|nr:MULTISPECIES: Fic family protein [unclassified Leuconostoc]MBK0040774.1 Fic family protein [Leuconostoc sp. S51]MBK0051804.1 Fic family protein [Leuconostoc sp. S50]
MSFDLNILTEKLNKMDSYRPLHQLEIDTINQQKKMEHVWSSNKIEGSTLEYSETEAILMQGVTLHGVPVKDVLETLDLSEAYDYMRDLATGNTEITENVIKDLNQLATMQTLDKNNPDGYPGGYRNVSVRPAGAEFNPYPEPFKIRKQMEDLIYWNETAQHKLHPVQYAAELHLRFVTIHPFLDGNGRTARLLMEFALTRNGYPITNIQPDQRSRIDYMNTLSDAQKTNNPQAFIDLVAGYVDRELTSRIGILQLSEQNHNEARPTLKPTENRFKHHQQAQKTDDNQNKGRTR